MHAIAFFLLLRLYYGCGCVCVCVYIYIYTCHAHIHSCSSPFFLPLLPLSQPQAPYESTLGGSFNVLQGIGAGTGHEGHISRNLRLCVAMADLVQPYVVWAGQTEDDDGPQSAIHPVSSAAENGVRWDVGGALTVDQTALFIIEAEDGDEGCPATLSESMLKKLRADAGGETGVPLTNPQHSTILDGANTLSTESYGGTIWTKMFAEVPSNPSVIDKAWSPFKGRYGQSHTFAGSAVGKRWIMVAGAKTDQDWGGPNSVGMPAGMPPQSHVVKARTIEGYTAQVGDSKLEGHLWWFSAPRCYVVTDGGGGVTTPDSGDGNGNGGKTSTSITSSCSALSPVLALILVVLSFNTEFWGDGGGVASLFPI